MKRVLIISYYFQQKDAIGAIRLRGLAKYLQFFGWETTIISGTSGKDESFNVHEVLVDDSLTKWKKILKFPMDKTLKTHFEVNEGTGKKSLLEFIIKLWEEIFAYPDTNRMWILPATTKGRDLLSKNHFDAIISSSSPVSVHLVAAQLVREFKLPWIADFRDPWTQNHYYHYSSIRKKIERKLEIRTIAKANHLVSVSKHFCEKLTLLHHKDISLIYNGFDPDNFLNFEKLSNKFSITYTGKIYSGSQDPDLLFRALNELLAQDLLKRQDLEVNFYGDINKEVFQNVIRYNLQNSVKFHGNVNRERALQSQRTSQLLLLLSWNDSEEKGVIPAKIYEYLAAKRPIFSIGHVGGGEVCTILEKTQSGFDLTDIGEIKQKILLAYDEFKTQGQIKYLGIQEEIDKFSQREMAKKFADVLEEVIIQYQKNEKI